MKKIFFSEWKLDNLFSIPSLSWKSQLGQSSSKQLATKKALMGRWQLNEDKVESWCENFETHKSCDDPKRYKKLMDVKRSF